MHETDSLQERVLILAPLGRDGLMTEKVLAAADIRSCICFNTEQLYFEIPRGVGAVILTNEALTAETTQQLMELMEAQPPWSDIPVILFPTNNVNAVALLQTLGMRTNATMMDRPVGVAILKSAVRSALRARRRQYQTRDLLMKLEEADRHKDLFLATLSHELRTPLTAMVGWVRLLRKGILDEATSIRALDVIERSVVTQTQLIHDILSVSRIITGKFQVDLTPVDFVSAIEAAIDAVTPTAKAKGIRIETFVDTSGALVMGDSVRLQQIVWNLLSNAVKFTPPGGVVELRLQRFPNRVRFAVQDSGEGISAEFLPHVFERFRQADSTYTRTTGGLGLGLSIVRHLVELHGGTVQAASEGLQQGAMFSIELPLLVSPELYVTPPISANPPDPKTKASGLPFEDLSDLRVLLVEDDPDTREMLATTLRRCGAEVHSADCSAAALKTFPSCQFDVVASDIGMPDEDGFELIKKIRLIEAGNPQTPAIALTGYASEADLRRSLAAGYQRHLPKPIEPEDLVRTIRELTDGRRRDLSA